MVVFGKKRKVGVRKKVSLDGLLLNQITQDLLAIADLPEL
jgi:hypothetical protein